MQLDKHALLERLLALGEVLDAVVERVHGPREESRQGHGEREDERKDPRATLVELDEHDPHRVEHAEHKVRRRQQPHPRHHGSDRRSNDAVPHRHNQEQEERDRVPARVQDARQHEQEPRHGRDARLAVDLPDPEKVDQVVVEVNVVDPLCRHLDYEERNGARDKALDRQDLVLVLDAEREPVDAKGDVGERHGKVKVELGVFGGGEVAFELVEELDAAVKASVDGDVALARGGGLEGLQRDFG